MGVDLAGRVRCVVAVMVVVTSPVGPPGLAAEATSCDFEEGMMSEVVYTNSTEGLFGVTFFRG